MASFTIIFIAVAVFCGITHNIASVQGCGCVSSFDSTCDFVLLTTEVSLLAHKMNDTCRVLGNQEITTDVCYTMAYIVKQFADTYPSVCSCGCGAAGAGVGLDPGSFLTQKLFNALYNEDIYTVSCDLMSMLVGHALEYLTIKSTQYYLCHSRIPSCCNDYGYSGFPYNLYASAYNPQSTVAQSTQSTSYVAQPTVNQIPQTNVYNPQPTVAQSTQTTSYVAQPSVNQIPQTNVYNPQQTVAQNTQTTSYVAQPAVNQIPQSNVYYPPSTVAQTTQTASYIAQPTVNQIPQTGVYTQPGVAQIPQTTNTYATTAQATTATTQYPTAATNAYAVPASTITVA